MEEKALTELLVKGSGMNETHLRKDFTETFDRFFLRFSREVGCYYHRCSSGVISLKKCDTNDRGKQKVFAWILERKKDGHYRIDTYERLAEKAKVTHFCDGGKTNLNWLHPGVYFIVQRHSV